MPQPYPHGELVIVIDCADLTYIDSSGITEIPLQRRGLLDDQAQRAGPERPNQLARGILAQPPDARRRRRAVAFAQRREPRVGHLAIADRRRQRDRGALRMVLEAHRLGLSGHHLLVQEIVGQALQILRIHPRNGFAEELHARDFANGETFIKSNESVRGSDADAVAQLLDALEVAH